MSVDGAEEDGVENRVDTPSRGPGEGPASSQEDDGSDGNAPPAASAARVSAPGATDQTHGAEFANQTKPAVTGPNPVITPPAAPTSAPAAPTSAPVAAPATAPAYRPAGDPASPPLMAPRPPSANGGANGGAAAGAGSNAQTALFGAANSARGLAAKVGSSFSGMTKPKPKARPRPGSPARRPGSPAGGPLPPQQATRSPQPGGSQQTRSALLSLQRIEPMSVMKFSFLISLVAWVVLFVAVAIIYFTLSKLGVFAKIEQTVGLVTYNRNHPGSNAASWFSASRVLEYTALVCTINAILFTALATVGAALYNLVTALTGGIEVTLRESD